MGRTIGIDLGTTNSCMAYVDVDGKPAIIPNAEGERTTPSVVAFEDDAVLVGKFAKQQAVVNPERTIASIKRHMGDESYSVEINGQTYRPQEISALVLKKLKRDAEAYLDDEVTDAVVTVPAYFDAIQRQATKEAGEVAGLNVQRVLDEPTAAAMAYGVNESERQTLIVFDLGGGTFDVSMLKLRDGRFSVVTTCGDNHLGGDDFDERIMRYLSDEFRKVHKVDLLSLGPKIEQRLREAAEDAKKQLSARDKTRVNIPFIVPEKALSLDVAITRQTFEALTDDLIRRTQEPVHQAIEESQLDASQIDVVLLAGGATRMPRVQAFVQKIMQKDASKRVNPDECVALGAALAAERGTRTVTFKVCRSIGVEITGGSFSKILAKGATLPTAAEEEYTTAKDDQAAIHFPIYQGEDPVAEQNTLLGEVRIDNVAPGPKGAAHINVRFEMNAEGILLATAKDMKTGKNVTVQVEGAQMSSEEMAQAKERVDALAGQME